MARRPKTTVQLNEQNARKIFDLLDARTAKLEEIADNTGISGRTVERLSSAKRLIEAGVHADEWPKRMRTA